MQAQLWAAVEQHLGPAVGLGQVKAILKEQGFGDLACQIAQLHRMRSMQAHPHVAIVRRFELAMEVCKQRRQAKHHEEK